MNRATERQTLIARLGSMTGITLSGCLAAWAIVDSSRAVPLGVASAVCLILGIWLARRASRALHGS